MDLPSSNIEIYNPHSRIRVEFHVARLGHALPCVNLLDARPQVVPYLVQAYLFQSVGVLGPVRRHRGARVLSLANNALPVLSPRSAPCLVSVLALALLSECAVHRAAALREAG